MQVDNEWVVEESVVIPLERDFVLLVKQTLAPMLAWIACFPSTQGEGRYLLLARRKGIQEFCAYECVVKEGAPTVWAKISPDHSFSIVSREGEITLTICRCTQVVERRAAS